MSKPNPKSQQQPSPAAPPDTDDTDSSSDAQSDDDMILRLASTQGAKASSHTSHLPANDDSDDASKGAQGKGGGKGRRAPPPPDPKKVAASEEWADKYAAKQEKRLAGRVEKGKVVTVKQERQRVAKANEADSGVTGALAQLALRKKKKNQLKKQRRNQQHTSDTDASEDDGEEEEEEGKAGPDASTAPPEPNQAADGKTAEDSEEDVDAEAVHYASLDEEVAAYRELHHIALSPLFPSPAPPSPLHSDPLYYPVRSFADLQSQFDLPALLTRALIPSTFRAPTPIQAQVWPLILAGRDVVGVAETGSGKSLGFLLGALVYALKRLGWTDVAKAATTDSPFLPPTSATPPSPPSPLALVLSPTRELALQTFALCESACGPVHLTAMSLVGGPSLDGQLALLSSHPPHLIVATPGRLLKVLGEGALSLQACGYVVLDEADRMLDLGFLPAIEAVLRAVRPSHQTLLFSATWPPAISDVARSVMRPDRALKVTVGSDDLTAARSVRQYVEVVDRRNGGRERRLLELLRSHPPSPTALLLVFTLYKRESTQLAQWLSRHGQAALALKLELHAGAEAVDAGGVQGGHAAGAGGDGRGGEGAGRGGSALRGVLERGPDGGALGAPRGPLWEGREGGRGLDVRGGLRPAGGGGVSKGSGGEWWGGGGGGEGDGGEGGEEGGEAQGGGGAGRRSADRAEAEEGTWGRGG